MSTVELLSRIRASGVSVWSEDGELRYRAAAGVMTPSLREELKVHKDELVAFLADAKVRPSQAPELRRMPRGESLPLSFAQQRLWFLDQLVPGNPFYNVPASVRLAAAVDVAVLERAVNAIVERHEALRTTFVSVDGRPRQRVAPALRVPVAVVDLRDLERRAREAEAARLAAEEAERPFDLERGPLLRVRVLRLGASDHVLLLTLHHIVADGWSMGVLFGELNALYGGVRARAAGLAAAGAAGPVRRLRRLAAPVADGRRARGAARLLARAARRSCAVLQLPTDRPRPAVCDLPRRAAARSSCPPSSPTACARWPPTPA